ncbi:hypothetical protein TRVL_10159 [Trypanosoma vivax]|uniref:Transcription and mRNA export factor ENY2 n=1 Tax=Trypanosoma vivax (strain Y486) TaxID=1055687 RepID=G0TZ72_TRYVY|nr:hypothetical protein TRVL_10159 [Trypanosoma vivax]CCC49275.1 conserved hypothetical protein [Trypanosoma vivax Y486]
MSSLFPQVVPRSLSQGRGRCCYYTQLHSVVYLVHWSLFLCVKLGLDIKVRITSTALSANALRAYHCVRMGEKDEPSASSGTRVYEGMTTLQKNTLRDYLHRELSQNRDWRQDVSRLVAEVVRRRSETAEPLDVHDVINEVLPYCRSTIPAEVREGLFRCIASTVGVDDDEVAGDM